MEIYYQNGKLTVKYQQVFKSYFRIQYTDSKIFESSFDDAVNSNMLQIKNLKNSSHVSKVVVQIMKHETRTLILKNLFAVFQNSVNNIYFELFKKKLTINYYANDFDTECIYKYDVDFICFKKMFYVFKKIIENVIKIKIIKIQEPDEFMQLVLSWLKNNKKVKKISLLTNIKDYCSEKKEYLYDWVPNQKIILDFEKCANLNIIEISGYNNINIYSVPINNPVKFVIHCTSSSIIKSDPDINKNCFFDFKIETFDNITNNIGKLINQIENINEICIANVQDVFTPSGSDFLTHIQEYQLHRSDVSYFKKYLDDPDYLEDPIPHKTMDLLEKLAEKKSISKLHLIFNNKYDHQSHILMEKIIHNNNITEIEIIYRDPIDIPKYITSSKINVNISTCVVLQQQEINIFSKILESTISNIYLDLTLIINCHANQDYFNNLLDLLFTPIINRQNITITNINIACSKYTQCDTCSKYTQCDTCYIGNILMYLSNIDFKSLHLYNTDQDHNSIYTLLENNPAIINLAFCDGCTNTNTNTHNKYSSLLENCDLFIDENKIRCLLENNRNYHTQSRFKKVKIIDSTI